MFLSRLFSIAGSLIDVQDDESAVGPNLLVMGHAPVVNLLPSGGEGGTAHMMQRRRRGGRHKK